MIHRFLHKKNIYLKIFLTLSIIHCQLLIATAQSPVRSQTILKPPYSTSLSDYYTNSDERLRLRLTNMDIKQPVIRARLQLHIISNKVTLRNRPFVGPIIELEAGVPNFLSGMDLAVYFNPANIEILSGLDYNALFQKPRLPDGTYTFRFDVIDANTGQLLSDIRYPQPSINIISNDPPFLNLPRKGDNIRYTDPLNIVFNWTPRAVIKGITDYQFSLYEINDNGMPPENVPFMSQPIYQTTISTTTFLYGATEPPLLPGKKYAWRIQALAKQGIDSYSLYNNDGYTETFWFQLQDNCDPPQQISAVVKGGAVTLEWLNNPAMFKYIVEYRKKGNDFNRWFNTETNNTKVIITDVAVGNSYEYRVGGICTVGAGTTYSDIRAFTIPPRDTSRNKTCGILPNINITNKNKLEILPIGANVMVGDYPATILSVTPNGGGSFSGTAAVRMNIFNIAETPVKAKFDNVAFNTDYKLIEGFMVTTYDKDEKQIFDADKVFEGGNDVGSVKTGLDATDISTNFPINKPEDIRVTLNTDGTAVIDITGANGQTKKIPVEKLPITIKDSEGTIYSVDKHGKVTKVGKAGAFKTVDFTKLNTIATDKAVVTFVAHDGQKYAFDQWKEEYNKSQLYKEKYEYLNGYRVSSKAIEAGKTDLVQARINISDKSIKPDSVRFVTGKGTQYESKYLGNNEYEITVVGGPAKDAQELYAIYSTDNNNYLSFGKLLISSYPHQKQKIILIPVNGAPVDKNKIADELNKIYNKIAVEFDVQQDAFDDKSWDIDKDGALKVDGSGLFSTLTDEMKALNNAYRGKRTIDKSTIYLFVLSKASQAGVVGDMPRNKQFGYLFTGNDGKTVAHEVGHGLFNLKHTFDSQYGFAKGELSSNVMDYPSGDQFSKLQWNAIHAPGLVIGVFEGDGDAKSVNLNDITKLKNYVNSKNGLTFINPAGKRISLPYEKLKQIQISTGDQWENENRQLVNLFSAIGVLESFKLEQDGTTIEYKARGNNTHFTGYYNEEKPYEDIITKELNSLSLNDNKALTGTPCYSIPKGEFVLKLNTIEVRGNYEEESKKSNEYIQSISNLSALSDFLSNPNLVNPLSEGVEIIVKPNVSTTLALNYLKDNLSCEKSKLINNIQVWKNAMLINSYSSVCECILQNDLFLKFMRGIDGDNTKTKDEPFFRIREPNEIQSIKDLNTAYYIIGNRLKQLNEFYINPDRIISNLKTKDELISFFKDNKLECLYNALSLDIKITLLNEIASTKDNIEIFGRFLSGISDAEAPIFLNKLSEKNYALLSKLMYNYYSSGNITTEEYLNHFAIPLSNLIQKHLVKPTPESKPMPTRTGHVQETKALVIDFNYLGSLLSNLNPNDYSEFIISSIWKGCDGLKTPILKPFDFITLYLNSDIEIPNSGIRFKEGQCIQLTAYEADILSLLMKRADRERAGRFMMNVGILAMPIMKAKGVFTGIIRTVEIAGKVVSLFDIGIQASKTLIEEHFDTEGKELLNSWDGFYNTVQTVVAVGGGIQLTRFIAGKMISFCASAGKIIGNAAKEEQFLSALRQVYKEKADQVWQTLKQNYYNFKGLLGLQGAGKLADQIDNTLSRLTGKAKYALNNTGEYKVVAGHHPMAKKAFEGDLVYDYQKAFSVATSELDKVSGITNLHPKITGQQNKLYTAWKQANPNAKLTIDAMADIEIQAMKNVGIPEDVATGWVVKALEDLKAQGVTEIKNIPWNGVN